MSVLTHKRLLMIGKDTNHLDDLEERLRIQGVVIRHADCANLTPESVQQPPSDMIIVNHLHDDKLCGDLLEMMRDARLDKVVPIFALVSNDEDEIQNALMLGAADYITPDEPADSVIMKMKAILGEPDNYSESSDIDISSEPTEPSKGAIRVYLVEDDPLLRNLLGIRFKKSAFPFEYSTDGKLAITAMKQFKPDVIILDLMLPGKSGFDVLKEIRDESQLKNVPVIVFSNRDGQDDKKKATELGAQKFYVKAMTDLSDLVKTIESLVATK